MTFLLFFQDPLFFSASNISPVEGLKTIPEIGKPFLTIATDIENSFFPSKKAFVPSSGSTTKVIFLFNLDLSSSFSSESQPNSGFLFFKSLFNKSFISISALETRLPSSFFHCSGSFLNHFKANFPAFKMLSLTRLCSDDALNPCNSHSFNG